MTNDDPNELARQVCVTAAHLAKAVAGDAVVDPYASLMALAATAMSLHEVADELAAAADGRDKPAVHALRGASERFSEAARQMAQASRRLAPGRWASD